MSGQTASDLSLASILAHNQASTFLLLKNVSSNITVLLSGYRSKVRLFFFSGCIKMKIECVCVCVCVMVVTDGKGKSYVDYSVEKNGEEKKIFFF